MKEAIVLPQGAAQRFVFDSRQPRVLFGAGVLDALVDEVGRLGMRHAMVLSTPGHADEAQRITAPLGGALAGIFPGAVMHVPVDTVQRAMAWAREHAVDGLVAVGGGSTTGLAKAMALQSGLPIVAIPTTYAGSEMTSIYGITEAGAKKTGRDPRVLPRTVLYDPTLMATLPAGLSIVSGLNAMAHAAEGLYARDGNPVMSLLAEEGIRMLAKALPAIGRDPADGQARADALYGACLSGMVLGSVGMALHHKLCHTLGGSFNLPHAQLHAILLPQALAFNAQAAPEAMRRIARALVAPAGVSAAAAVFDLAHENGAPTALQDIGMQDADLARAADLAVRNPYWNPRPIGPAQRTDILALLQRAQTGVRPD